MYLSHHGGLFLTHTNILFKMGKNQRFTELSLESIGIKGSRISGGDFEARNIFFQQKKSSYDYIFFFHLNLSKACFS